MTNEEKSARELAEELKESLNDDSVDADVDDLEERFEQYIQYDVHPDSARQTILRNLAGSEGKEVGEILEESDGGSGLVNVDDIDEADQFVTVEVEVTELWDNDNDVFSQVGLVHDNTGRIKFKSWSKSEKPLLTEGQSYRLENVSTDEYQGRMSIALNKETEVQMIDDEFEAPDTTETFTGAIVDIRAGSGLIRRCTVEECTRVLQNGECSEHGDVEGEFDMRIKGVLDNGEDTQRFILGREMTEELTGLSQEEAEQMAKDALNTDVVGEEMADRVMLNYITVEGWVNQDYDELIVQEADFDVAGDTTDVTGLVERLNALNTEDFEQGDINEVN